MFNNLIRNNYNLCFKKKTHEIIYLYRCVCFRFKIIFNHSFSYLHYLHYRRLDVKIKTYLVNILSFIIFPSLIEQKKIIIKLLHLYRISTTGNNIT